jgi:phage gpG-like protein
MPSFGNSKGMINGSMVKFAVGGMRFDHEIEAGWQISPSLGLVAADIDRLGLSIENTRIPITRAIVQVMIPSIAKNFASEGRPVPWEPLAEYTRSVRGNAGPILNRTGKLKRGVTKLHIWKIKDDSATIIELPQEIWYGAVHQSGYGGFAKYVKMAKAMAPKGARPAQITQLAFKLLDQVSPSRQAKIHIPQRQFLMFQEDDVDDIQQVFAEWLEDEAKKVGRFEGRSVRTVWGGPSF